MKIFSFISTGYNGVLVNIETDIFKRSLPGIDIVGLPGGAVKESKVRFRSAILNSGFDFPKGRVIINMSPAGEKKEGACYDLPFALKVLFHNSEDIDTSFLVLGELTLSGKVIKVKGVLPAVLKAYSMGIEKCIIPKANLDEAIMAGVGNIYPVSNLCEAVEIIKNREKSRDYLFDYTTPIESLGDFSDIKGQQAAKRAVEIAVAGGHNLLLFGPPGVGKTLTISRISSILPPFSRKEALETTRIWSLAGKLTEQNSIITTNPIRKPHHSATLEGLMGGGPQHTPGEVSLAHNGYLLLDEMPEFKSTILQSLREPIEEKRVSLSRAAKSVWFPANFRLFATANPCPCGNLGKENGLCLCSDKEIRRYWKRLGGAIMDRIDIRVPVKPVSVDTMLNSREESSFDIKKRVIGAVTIQTDRFTNTDISCNGQIPPGEMDNYCHLESSVKETLISGIKSLNISSRGFHSILKIARTIADLSNSDQISEKHILEALTYRRYGDDDYYFC